MGPVFKIELGMFLISSLTYVSLSNLWWGGVSLLVAMSEEQQKAIEVQSVNPPGGNSPMGQSLTD